MNSSKSFASYFVSNSFLVFMMCGFLAVSFVATDEFGTEFDKPGENVGDFEAQIGVELDEEEDSFQSLFIYTDIGNLDVGLATEINTTKEVQEAYSWPNSSQAYILSIAGQVSLPTFFCL